MDNKPEVIADSKKAEISLARLAIIVRDSSDAIISTTVDGIVDSWNTSAQRLFGYSAEEILGKHIAMLAPAGALDAVNDSLAKMRQGEALHYESECCAKNGSSVMVSVVISPIRDQAGVVVGVSAIYRDITEGKRGEEALRFTNALLLSQNEASLDGTLLVDEAGKIVSFNTRFTEIWGIPPEVIASRSDERALQVVLDKLANPEEFLARVKHLYAHREEKSREDVALRDGRTLDRYSAPMISSDGKYYGRVWHFRDITGRKKVEAERERLMTAIDQVGESITITSTEGNIQYVNPAFEKICGYTFAEIIGKNSRILKSGRQDGPFYKKLWGGISSGRTWAGRLVNKRKDGTFYTVDATISPVKDPAGKIVNYVAVKKDITAQLQLENQYLQSQKMEAVGLLAGGVAHDFNNILTAIRAYAGFIHKDLPLGSSMCADAQEILIAADRAAALTRQLLVFSRKQVMSPRAVDISKIVGEMTKMLKRLLREDIELNTKITLTPCRVMADPGQIEQVLMNLVVNARDAMPNGGTVNLETDIVDGPEILAAHTGLPRGPVVRLRISDTGSGMTAVVKEHLFEPFFTTKEKGKGTGLGLSTVFGIVKQSGGDIDVKSELNRGATFTIYLPYVEDIIPGKVERKDQETPLKGKETVLFVEDEDSLRRVGQRVLRAGGYTVLVAADGQAALKLMEERGAPVDILMTDLMMPVMSGRDLAKELARRKLATRTLYMSGYTDDAIAAQGVIEPGIAFIYKPYTVDALLIKLREVLDAPADQAKA